MGMSIKLKLIRDRDNQRATDNLTLSPAARPETLLLDATGL